MAIKSIEELQKERDVLLSKQSVLKDRITSLSKKLGVEPDLGPIKELKKQVTEKYQTLKKELDGAIAKYESLVNEAEDVVKSTVKAGESETSESVEDFD